MSGINLNSFTLMESEVTPQQNEPGMAGTPDEARPSAPSYKVQPVAWMGVMLALAVIGLYFFLED